MRKTILATLMFCSSVALAGNPNGNDAQSRFAPPRAPAKKVDLVIALDTSGSMSTEDVPGDPYDPLQTYSGSYTQNGVYYRVYNNRTGDYDWVLLTSSINSINDSAGSNGNDAVVVVAPGYCRRWWYRCRRWRAWRK